MNLLEPPRRRDSKVWRVLSHEFRMVRLYRTFSNYIVTGETRCAGGLCPSSGWFKHSEPPRTFSNHFLTEIARCGELCHMSSGRCSNHFITEIARCVEFFYRSSGWLDYTAPSLATSLQGKQEVQHSEPTRIPTISNFVAERARCEVCLHLSSGWFDCTEHSLTTSLQGIQGVQGAKCTSSGRFKHSEPPRTFSNYILTELA